MSGYYGGRGHQKQQDSFGGGGGGSWDLPPLSLSNTLALQLGFALKGAQDAVNLKVAGEKIQLDKVSRACTDCRGSRESDAVTSLSRDLVSPR